MRFVSRTAAAGIALGLLAGAAGCGSGSIDYQGESVRDPDTFLTNVERAWTADLAERRVNKHAEAQCYYATQGDSSDVDSLAYCGPVRHYSEPPSDADQLTAPPPPSAKPGSITRRPPGSS